MKNGIDRLFIENAIKNLAETDYRICKMGIKFQLLVIQKEFATDALFSIH
jgi:hypothetical protein